MKKVGIFAALFAVICGIAVYLYLGSVERRVAEAGKKQLEPEKMVSVVVAGERIPPYTALTAEMLRTETRPAEYTSAEAARSFDEVIGLRADGTLAEGEVILTSTLGTVEELNASLSYDVPDGMRAMTVDMGVSAGVGGYLTKDDLIDLMLYMAAETADGDASGKLITAEGKAFSAGESVTSVVLEAARILELGDVGFDAAGGGVYSSITLALYPADCLKLLAAMKQAQAGGELYAVLRQRGDVSKTDTGVHAFADLMKGGGRP